MSRVRVPEGVPNMARWSSGLRLRPLTPATAVRIRYGSPHRRRQQCRRRQIKLVLMTVRVHPFPSRTRQLSSLVPTILGWKRPGKIGRRQHKRKHPTKSWGVFSYAYWGLPQIPRIIVAKWWSFRNARGECHRRCRRAAPPPYGKLALTAVE